MTEPEEVSHKPKPTLAEIEAFEYEVNALAVERFGTDDEGDHWVEVQARGRAHHHRPFGLIRHRTMSEPALSFEVEAREWAAIVAEAASRLQTALDRARDRRLAARAARREEGL